MDANVVVTQVSSAAVVVWAIQALKNWKAFPWLQSEGTTIRIRVVSLIAALVAHTGISYVWNGSFDAGGQLTITIPMGSMIILGLWHWFNQFVMQELIYKGTVNRAKGA